MATSGELKLPKGELGALDLQEIYALARALETIIKVHRPAVGMAALAVAVMECCRGWPREKVEAFRQCIVTASIEAEKATEPGTVV